MENRPFFLKDWEMIANIAYVRRKREERENVERKVKKTREGGNVKMQKMGLERVLEEREALVEERTRRANVAGREADL